MQCENKIFNVYLLSSLNPRYRGRLYIGFTVDPQRRLRQHNRGSDHGGARKTSNKGPWDLILIVNGFPNEVAALRFEWTWQHPEKSRVLAPFIGNTIKRSESELEYHLMVLNEMINCGPWTRLPLKMYIISEDNAAIVNRIVTRIPSHMRITMGKEVEPQAQVQLFNTWNLDEMTCTFCSLSFFGSNHAVFCKNVKCNMFAHLLCISRHLVTSSNLIPSDGYCPLCSTYIHFVDMVVNQILDL